MMQIDNTQKTKAIYEQMLHDFNDLNKISIAEIDNQIQLTCSIYII